MKSNFIASLIAGKPHPTIERNRAIGAEILRLQRRADTLNAYARAAAKTFAKSGRESCLAAQSRFETAALALVERIYQLNLSR